MMMRLSNHTTAEPTAAGSPGTPGRRLQDHDGDVGELKDTVEKLTVDARVALTKVEEQDKATDALLRKQLDEFMTKLNDGHEHLKGLIAATAPPPGVALPPDVGSSPDAGPMRKFEEYHSHSKTFRNRLQSTS